MLPTCSLCLSLPATTVTTDAYAGCPCQSLNWTFGFNSNIIGGVHSLADDSRDALFYVSAHTGVIYDYRTRRQKFLQGHCNAITCACISEDKRWIATADAGPDSMIVVWDSTTGTPIKTIFNPHPNGVVAMDMSPDAMFLVTLSKVAEDDTGAEAEPQSIALWEWTVDRDGPLYRANVPAADVQNFVRFNPADIREIVSNGPQRVVFWNWHSRKFKFYSPPLSQRDFRQAVGAFTVSSFIPGTTQAVTATVDGDCLLWDQSMVGVTDGYGRASDRRAVKVVKLVAKGDSIEYMTVIGRYLVCGSADGAVRFYDFGFRLVAWFEDMDGGPVTSVSFSAGHVPLKPDDEDAFEVPDFLTGTRRALIIGLQASMFEELTADQRRGTLLVQGMDDEVHGMSVHPYLPQMALACYSGAVHLWDFEERQLLMVRLFDPARLRPQTVAFDAHGRFLFIGFTNGAVKVVDAARLQDTQPTFKNSLGAVTDIRVSADSQYMATADADRCVAIYRYMTAQVRPPAGTESDSEEEGAAAKREQEQWVYLGKYRAHSRPITGLEFGMSSDGAPLLVSVGEDRRRVEYDVRNTSIARGVSLKGKRTKIEQSATPTACLWHPRLGRAREDSLITASDEYKFKLWNPNSATCRRTVLAPTYGGPVNRLTVLPRPAPRGTAEDEEKAGEAADPAFLVYGTNEKVVGLVMLPLDGNPDAAMGLIAHPGEVSAIAASCDGRYLVTAGGNDMCVNLWAVDTTPLETLVAASGGTGSIDPYVALLEGGREGEFYQEICDFFTYAQLRGQGEDSTSPRRNTGKVPLSELPNLMRALGFYPTEQEVENMIAEVKYSQFAVTGDTVETVSLDDLIRLYVNHRPVLGIGKAQIHDAMRILVDRAGDFPLGTEAGSLPWHHIATTLKSRAERLDDRELATCLQALIGDDSLAPSSAMTAAKLAHTVLGFEDYEAGADGGGEAGGDGGDGATA